MTDQELLNLYKPMVPFLASLCGNSCEVLLHDISKPNSSVIAVANGFHSGRSIGSPLTDLAIQIYKDDIYKEKDYLSNYSGYAKDRKFVSNTYFIKNEGRLIGLLCVNRDTSLMGELDHLINAIKDQFNLKNANAEEFEEALDNPAADILRLQVSRAIEEAGISPQRMGIDERVHLVARMRELGVLELKGAVKEVALQMGISEPTVYRYLRRAQEE